MGEEYNNIELTTVSSNLQETLYEFMRNLLMSEKIDDEAALGFDKKCSDASSKDPVCVNITPRYV